MSAAHVPYTPYYVLPDSLDDLHGPTSGEVILPNRLMWNLSHPFNLADENRHLSMMRIVLREARQPEDIEAYINRESLISFWDKLVLPARLKKEWQEKFPVLKSRTTIVLDGSSE